MAGAVKRKVTIVLYKDNGTTLKIEESPWASLVKARQWAVAMMKAKNSPLARVSVYNTLEKKWSVFELIYGTPMGTMYWCNCKIDNSGYKIYSSGVPGASVIHPNIWTVMSKDIPWALQIHGAVVDLRSRKWTDYSV